MSEVLQTTGHMGLVLRREHGLGGVDWRFVDVEVAPDA
jgi:hypothetical protein